MKKSQLTDSIKALEHALGFEDLIEEDKFYFSGISKCFEVCLEYAWKYLRQVTSSEGYEVVSPKDAIRRAGQIGTIDSVEKWLEFIDDRNLAVHDYVGFADSEYLDTIRNFLVEVKKL